MAAAPTHALNTTPLTPANVCRALAEVGHELRNPLGALSNALEVWPSIIGNPALMDELHHLMVRQVQQLVRLSEDLLEVARITEGRFQLRFEPCDLKDVIVNACEQLRPMLERFGHAMRMDMPDVPVPLLADAERLVQVFSNLGHNAIKFSPGGEGLRVAVDISTDFAVITVLDHGAGIETQRLRTIFEPFVQVDGRNTSEGTGVGLGLALVRAIVEGHGGDVSVYSPGLGRGSEFIVRLPLLHSGMQNGPGAIGRQVNTQRSNNLGATHDNGPPSLCLDLPT